MTQEQLGEDQDREGSDRGDQDPLPIVERRQHGRAEAEGKGRRSRIRLGSRGRSITERAMAGGDGADEQPA